MAPTVNRWLMGACVLVLASGPAQSDVPDPRAQGPYAVGVVKDSVKNGRTVIPLYVFYPVDKTSVTASSPKFDYEQVWNFTHAGVPLPTVIPSAIWESHGVEAAYASAPVARGPFPLVAWDNANGNEATVNIKLFTRLASHGYVVAAVFWETTDWPFPALYCPKAPESEAARVILQRAQNVRLMLDRMLSRNGTSGDRFFHKMDAQKIGATGWSWGGLQALILASGITTPTGSSSPDPRVKAILTLDPGSGRLTDEELRHISIPIMSTGTPAGPEGLFGDGSPTTARVHAMVSSDVKYRVDIRNTIHGSYGVSLCAFLYTATDAGIFGDPPPPYSIFDDFCNNPSEILPEADFQNTLFTYVIAFFKTHLENVLGYGDVLTPGWSINVESNADFFKSSEGDFEALVVPNSCTHNYDGGYKFMLRQPGVTSNNASTDRDGTMFSNGTVLPDALKVKLGRAAPE